jgi:hypothetical protein
LTGQGVLEPKNQAQTGERRVKAPAVQGSPNPPAWQVVCDGVRGCDLQQLLALNGAVWGFFSDEIALGQPSRQEESAARKLDFRCS